MISKVIHYCWFGGAEKPPIVNKCIESWHTHLPDYEFFEWNESNFDVNACVWTKEAYDAKKWAFVSDYARLFVVYNHGGIYLDTDVEIKNEHSLDNFLDDDCFLFFENEYVVASGLGFGAVKEHKLIGSMLGVYEKQDKFNDKILCPELNTQAVEEALGGFCRSNVTQTFEYDGKVSVYSRGVYNACMRHLYSRFATGAPRTEYYGERRKKESKFLLRRRQPKKIAWWEKHFGKKGKKFYVFMVFDLPEYGLWYFIKKLFKRKKKK